MTTERSYYVVNDRGSPTPEEYTDEAEAIEAAKACGTGVDDEPLGAVVWHSISGEYHGRQVVWPKQGPLYA